MVRTTTLVATAALAAVIGLAGCGSDGPGPRSGASTSPSGADSTTPAPSPASRSGLSREHPGRLELVRADDLPTKGRCVPAPGRGLVCGPDGTSYRFDPDRVATVGVMDARVAPTPQGSGDWSVRLALGPAGTKVLGRLTRAAARTHESVLLMVPGSRRVLVAARVQAPIEAGILEIGGGFDRARAGGIVKLVTATGG
jgi:hypothetical protein